MPETNRKTVLTFIGHYLPGYKSGGTVRAISNLLQFLSDKHNFKIITRDRDLLDDKPYPGIKINDWNSLPDTEVFYYDLKTSIRKVINTTPFDMYYINSLFDFNFSIKIVLMRKMGLIPRKPLLLAPHGELMPGALSVKKLKKRTYLLLSKLLKLYSNVTWHASNAKEAEDIKREYGTEEKIKVAPDIPAVNGLTPERNHKKEKNKLKILFISVISPKKNLLFVIDVLNKVHGDFTLDIYGPIKDQKYWEKCLRQIDGKIKDKINYKGPISYDKINMVYPNYDLFFFPTLGESYGHVIFEALSFGCPVLCSNNTPFNDLEKYNAGWNIKLDNPKQYADLIENLISLDYNSYSKYTAGCKDYLAFFNNEENIVGNNLQLFEN